MPDDLFRVTRNGVHRFGPASYTECVAWVNNASQESGISVDWLLKYRGYAIVAASPQPVEAKENDQ